MHRKAAVAGDTGHYSFFPKMRLFARADLSGSDVTPFIGPGLMRVGGRGHAAAPC